MTTPEYDNAIPQPDDALSDSQLDMQQNFQALLRVFGINHVNLGQSLQGTHTIGELVHQNQGPEINLTEVGLYGATSYNGMPNYYPIDHLFLKFGNNTANFPITSFQIPPYFPPPTAPGTPQTDFTTMLPGGFILYFGSLACTLNPQPLQFKMPPKQIVGAYFNGNQASPRCWPFPQPILDSATQRYSINVYQAPGVLPIAASVFYTVIGTL